MTPTNNFRWKQPSHQQSVVSDNNGFAIPSTPAPPVLQQWWRVGGEDDFPRSDEGEWRDVPVVECEV
jgi:hypothetical protein